MSFHGMSDTNWNQSRWSFGDVKNSGYRQDEGNGNSSKDDLILSLLDYKA